MIRRLLAGLLGALALAACAAEPAPDWPDPKPALWHVTGADGVEGWLFGTVHALPEGASWETPMLAATLDQAGVLVVEVADLGDSEAAQAAFAHRAYASGLPPLTRRFPAAEREAVVALIAAADRTEADFANLETWAAALLLAGGERMGDPALGVDRALLARAMPVQGLEGFAAQYAVFDRLPQAEQQDLLLAVADEVAAADPAGNLTSWLTGDVAALERRAFAGMMGDPQLRAALLDDRNRAWLPQVAVLLDQGRKPFVAVGAVHMLGETGLPALLAAHGYTVTRIQ